MREDISLPKIAKLTLLIIQCPGLHWFEIELKCFGLQLSKDFELLIAVQGLYSWDWRYIMKGAPIGAWK